MPRKTKEHKKRSQNNQKIIQQSTTVNYEIATLPSAEKATIITANLQNNTQTMVRNPSLRIPVIAVNSKHFSADLKKSAVLVMGILGVEVILFLLRIKGVI